MVWNTHLQLYKTHTLVPRPFPPPVFDRLQAGMAWEQGYRTQLLIKIGGVIHMLKSAILRVYDYQYNEHRTAANYTEHRLSSNKYWDC